MKEFIAFEREQLENDLLFSKIPEGDIPKIIDMSLSLAEKMAHLYKNEILSLTPEKWLLKHNIKIVEKDKKNDGCIRTYAEYNSDENVIYMYNQTINNYPLNFIDDYVSFKKFVLLHECFHVIEQLESLNCKDLYTVYHFKFGKFKFFRSGILQISELAANAFAYSIINESRG